MTPDDARALIARTLPKLPDCDLVLVARFVSMLPSAELRERLSAHVQRETTHKVIRPLPANGPDWIDSVVHGAIEALRRRG
jgi:hypothetical protein